MKVGLAIGFENDYYGEEIGAYIVIDEGADVSADEILDYCREKMTFEKSPKAIVFGTDIPVTSTGKYQRLKLAPQFAEWKSTQFRKEHALFLIIRMFVILTIIPIQMMVRSKNKNVAVL